MGELAFESGFRIAFLEKDRELCELLDVPLGPTREALKRLEAESLVRLIPQRGIQIADIGLPGAGPKIARAVERLAREILDAKLHIRAACAARTVSSRAT